MKRQRPAVAVVGCGAWGKNHLRVWNELGCLKVASDLDSTRLEGVATRYPGVETYANTNMVLDRPDIDAVVIATPSATHSSLAEQALEAGKDVLVEKPMALTVAAGRHLVELAGQSDRVLMVGHVLEYHPAIPMLRKLIQEGSMGQVQYIYSNRLSLGKVRTEENALWSFAPHDVAIILRLLGRMPEEVACQGGSYVNQRLEDMTRTNLSFSLGVQAHIFVSWLHPFKEQRFVLVGDRQMAVFDDTRPWPEKLILYPHRVDGPSTQVPVAHAAEGIPVLLNEVEPLRQECEHFLHCVTNRQQPLTDGGSGLRVLQVLEAAHHSLKQGNRRIPLASERHAQPYSVHRTATVDAGAKIGDGTQIWHHSHVMPNAKLGRNCVLGQNVFVGRGVSIGEGVKVQNNVSIFEGVELEDYVFCGPSMVFTNVINPRSEIERKHEFGKTLVKRGATLGANCTVLCGSTIGGYAFVGAGAVVTKNIPDYALVVGVPARIVGWMCECGEKIQFEGGTAPCPACGKEYRRVDEDKVERSS